MEYKELWSYDEITEKIEDFLELYSKRPIKYNKGGMVTPHMFAIYFILISVTKILHSKRKLSFFNLSRSYTL